MIFFLISAELPTFDLCDLAQTTARQTLGNLVSAVCLGELSNMVTPLFRWLDDFDSSLLDYTTVDCK